MKLKEIRISKPLKRSLRRDMMPITSKAFTPGFMFKQKTRLW